MTSVDQEIARNGHGHVVAESNDIRLDGDECVGNDLVELDRFAAERDCSARDPRDVDEIIDHVREMRELAPQDRHLAVGTWFT